MEFQFKNDMNRPIYLLSCLLCCLGGLAASADSATNAFAAAAPQGATTNNCLENSLGMRFILLRGSNIWLSLWETRIRDYEAYIQDTGGVWVKPGFEQTDVHPVVNVNWEDASAFCRWLTDRDRESGFLKGKARYRLPTDEEWSIAAGMGQETGATPEERSKNALIWPWGSVWPPREGMGNYAPGLKTDRHEHTSPVASFAPNRKGFFDMGGNVWEWCEDWYNAAGVMRVLRGGSWAESEPGYLLASYRFHGTMNLSNDDIGFRVVLQRP